MEPATSHSLSSWEPSEYLIAVSWPKFLVGILVGTEVNSFPSEENPMPRICAGAPSGPAASTDSGLCHHLSQAQALWPRDQTLGCGAAEGPDWGERLG